MVARSANSVGAIEQPEIFEAECVAEGGVRKLRGISFAEAVVLRRKGADVAVCGKNLKLNQKLAGSIEFQANGRWKRCSPHVDAGPKALPHYQPLVRGPHGHTFYETQHRKAIR
jgi:hypothetical protein